MDDNSTRRQLEQLADLFLTGPGAGSGAGTELSSSSGTATATTEPRPFRLAPSPASSRHVEANRAAAEPTERYAPRRPRHIEQPAVEAVMLGHLPGFAAPWLGQYADHLAERFGSVAVVRLHSDAIEIDSYHYGSDEDEAEDPDAYRFPCDAAATAGLIDDSGDPDDGFVAAGSFERTLKNLGPHVALWLVHVPDAQSPAARRLAGRFDHWTVLTGGDEAAVVGAFGLIKGLIGAEADADAEVGPRPVVAPREVRLMFMGCDDDVAERAAQRLRTAIGRFMAVPVAHVGVRRRMQPVRRRTVATFEAPSLADIDAIAVLERFLRALPPRRLPLPVVHDDPSVAESRTPDASAARPLSDEELASLLDAPRVDDAPLKTPGGPVPAPAQQPEPIRAAPTGDSAIRGPQSAIPLDLSGYISAAALKPRCPRHADVQLAVDPDGRLHLMLFADEHAANAAIRRLAEARSWAIEHRELLAFACPDHGVDAADPIMHLFTDKPRPAAALAYAGLLDRPVRLHLLKSIEVAGQTVAVHEELG